MKNSAEGVKLLETSEQAHPEDSWTHYKLLGVYMNGKPRNPQRLSEEIDTYLKLCPTPSGGRVYRVIASDGTHEQMMRHCGQLRLRLESETVEPNQTLWTVLWNLEFKPLHRPNIQLYANASSITWRASKPSGIRTWKHG